MPEGARAAARLLLAGALICGSVRAAPRHHGQAAQPALESTRARGRALAAALSEQARGATARLRRTEVRSAETQSLIDVLAARRQALRAELARDEAALAHMLPLTLRLSLFPGETLLAAPAPTADALGALAVLHGLAAGLEYSAEHVRARQREVDRLTASLETQDRNLARLHGEQAARDAQIEAQARRAARIGQAADDDAQNAADAEAREAAARAATASSLRGAIARLRSSRNRLVPGSARQVDALGGVAVPVAGPLVQGWGARTDAGPATGLTYAPPALALVAAPCSGQVDFAGRFRSYGHMLILNCGHGYRFVLAGMEQLDVDIGQMLAKGAPVGRMPDWDADRRSGRAALYVQLRLGSQAIDPADFPPQHS